jgi:hypothetical protein
MIEWRIFERTAIANCVHLHSGMQPISYTSRDDRLPVKNCYAPPVKYGNIALHGRCQNRHHCLCRILASSRCGYVRRGSNVYAIFLPILRCHLPDQIRECADRIRPRSYILGGLADHNNCRNLALLRGDGKLCLASHTWEKVAGTLCNGPRWAAIDGRSRYRANPGEVSLHYYGWHWLPNVRLHCEKTGIARRGCQVFGAAPLRTSAIRLTAWNAAIYTVDSAPGMVPASLE